MSRVVCLSYVLAAVLSTTLSSRSLASESLGNAPGKDQNTITFDDCSIGSAAVQLPAKCTTLDVPLNPQAPEQGSVSLSVARIESRQRSGNTDAFTLIAGGPGQSAIESYPAVAFAFRHILRTRDLILIDQRGTGNSSPLNCPQQDESTTLDAGLDLKSDPQEIAQHASTCLQSLDADPQWFTTSVAVQDLENVRTQLGISEWNLYGISYGTRVATHYLRRYPEAVRTVILDAVVPPEVSLGPDIAALAQDALEHIFARCEADNGCNAAFGNLTESTLMLLEELESNPRSITYEDVATGQLTSRDFTAEHLAVTLRLLSYSSQTAAILPSMLFEAINNNNLAPLARQADMQSSSLGNSMSTGMHHAVICTEDVPFFTTNTDTSASEPVRRSYLGTAVISAIEATCSAWPPGIIDDDFKQPLISDKPVLVLSGGADPITPPAYGEQLVSTLNNAKHIVNEAQGHMQAPFGCMPILMAQFVDMAEASALQTDCLERLQPTPFFVDANGPLP